MMVWRMAAVLGLAALGSGLAQAQTLRGREAFGDWRADRPGLRRLITPQDMPAPDPAHSSASEARLVARPADQPPMAPEGFRVELLLSGLVNPRVVRVAPDGGIFVSETEAGRVRLLRLENGKITANTIFAQGLDDPFGVAFPPGEEPGFVYVATQTRVLRYPWKSGAAAPSGPAQTIVRGLPSGGHWTRDIAFSKDGKTLFGSVGSETNVADTMKPRSARAIAQVERTHGIGAAWGPEKDRAVVLAFDPDGGRKRTFATGIRNCAGLAVDPASGAPWCATNERDLLGDDLPPDYATRVRAGAFYGWPWYYIGAHEDPRLKGARPDLAGKVTMPDVLIQAHSAPLGIAFYTGTQFPEIMRGSPFVTLHGSWNRAKRTGSKVVRLILRDGEPTGEYEDFLTGFTAGDTTLWGRVVGIAMAADGSLLVSDDGAGLLWRVSYGP